MLQFFLMAGVCGPIRGRGQIKKLELKRAKESAKKTHRYLWEGLMKDMMENTIQGLVALVV